MTLQEELDLSGPQFPHLQDEGDNQVFPDSLHGVVSGRSSRGWQGSRERRLGSPPRDVHETGAAAVRLARLSFAAAPSRRLGPLDLRFVLCVVREQSSASFKEAREEPG